MVFRWDDCFHAWNNGNYEQAWKGLLLYMTKTENAFAELHDNQHYCDDSETTTNNNNTCTDPPLLVLPWYFGVLCWSYTFGGFVLLAVPQKPRWAAYNESGRFFFNLYAYLLMFVQGPISFWADYVHGTEHSIFQVIDRFVAIPLGLFTMTFVLRTQYQTIRRSVSWLAALVHVVVDPFFGGSNNNTRPTAKDYKKNGPWWCLALVSLGLDLCTIWFAIYSFLQSQSAQSRQDWNGYIFWHNCWHSYPVLKSVVHVMDLYVLGGGTTRNYSE